MSEQHSEPENLIDFLVHKGNGVKGLSQLNLPKIPTQFIQPPNQRLQNIHVSTHESIPVIDLSRRADPGVAESICEAARKWGFFQITGHGVPIEVLESVKMAAHGFFELPAEERRRYLKGNCGTESVVLKTSFSPLAEEVLEWKDYLVHFVGSGKDDYELWPSLSRDQVLEYTNQLKPVIRNLLDILLNGINVSQIDNAKQSALMGSLVANLLYYPRCPNPDLAAGAGPHSDISSITVLLQDDVGGLYVRGPEVDDDRWVHVAPVQGSLVVNIGDVLQIMSNDRYKSAEHRVFVSRNKNRVSVPVFVNPSSDAVIGPLEEAMEDGERPIYKRVVYSDYFGYFFSKGHDGKLTIDYARV